MSDNQLQPRESLNKTNKAFLKVKPDRERMEKFRANLLMLLDRINEAESEEFHKNLVADFLKNTYYSPSYFINTKERNDLVIHNGKEAKSPVGVILEAKKPRNKAEMLKVENLNTKAFQELVLYFLRERITKGNLEIKYLVATNVYEWFIFDAREFDKFFVGNKDLVKQFEDFKKGGLSITKTDAFYKEIAKPAIANIEQEIKFTYFDLRDYREDLSSLEGHDSQKLMDLYKIFSPEHLLKLPFANDSNTLNKPFYNELLHIIGLTEIKVGGKKLIGRKQEGDRDSGSLMENAISRLDSLDKMGQLRNPEEFGDTKEEQLFNVALRLSITWINRILFLKLLEAQLIKYHRGDQAFAFLNLAKVQNYNDLNSLFFEVLACEQSKRDGELKRIFAKVPYLNSSLFELTDIEQQTIVVSNLRDRNLPIFGASVLKDDQGKRRSGELNALAYLFEFLSAYNFSSDELESGEEDSEKLINAAVLGLIFEKINGYKDGSFYTPSFITMYMCRETIRRAVVQKFKEMKGWECADIGDLYERITDKQDANKIINSLKICDPAVGSGHFLVSALNEIIVIKRELGVLLDRGGKSLRDYRVEVRNDKLLVYDDEGKLFAYNPKNKESQRVQEALFHEKQTIIENCLFGVDINPNSVTICRLRLWIELLKNAYYKENGELETLPNIDINIKCGNSLISRFPIDSDLKTILFSQENKSDIGKYRNAVRKYFEAKTKEDKKAAEKEIKEIKEKLNNSLKQISPQQLTLTKLQEELAKLEDLQRPSSLGIQIEVLDAKAKKIQKDRENRIVKLCNDIDKLTVEIDDFKSGKIYSNALEWRFEFPEVLNDDGDFVGFDVVIGNPPYIRQEEIKELKPILQKNYKCYTGVADLFVYFYELGLQLLKPKGHLTYISSNKYFRAGYGEKLRQFLTDSTTIYNLIDFGDFPVFEEAIAYPSIITLSKSKAENNQVQALSWDETKKQNIAQFATILDQDGLTIAQENLKSDGWRLESSKILDLLVKLRNTGKPLGEYVNGRFYRGILTGFNEAFVVDRATRDKLIAEHPSSAEVLKPLLRGRDVKRWHIEYQDLWIIFTRRGTDIKKYPAIEKYLDQFKNRLTAGVEGGRKAGSYEWYEIQDNLAYWQEFEQPKIIYPNICRRNEFTWDELGYYANQKAFIIPCNDKVLLAVLNSSVVMFLFERLLSKLQGDFYEPSSIFMKDFPIPSATESEREAIETLVQKCLDAQGKNVQETEKALDRLVYKLYDLTEEEIKIVEGER